MDPNETYMQWEEARAMGDTELAAERYEQLRTWLERGGFEPDWNSAMRRMFFAWSPAKNAFTEE